MFWYDDHDNHYDHDDDGDHDDWYDDQHDDDDGENLLAAGVLAADLGSIVVPRKDRIRSVFRIVSRKTWTFLC